MVASKDAVVWPRAAVQDLKPNFVCNQMETQIDKLEANSEAIEEELLTCNGCRDETASMLSVEIHSLSFGDEDGEWMYTGMGSPCSMPKQKQHDLVERG